MDLQSEYDAAESCAEDNLDRAPTFTRQDVQIASERDSRQKIRKEDIDAARHYKLVEDGPVG